MPRPDPRDVFNDPATYWEFLTQPEDGNFEGQHFDRKEAGRPNSDRAISSSDFKNIKEKVRQTVSAFANSNNEGGLLVLGISSTGYVEGIDHLDETTLNAITSLEGVLRNHATEIKTSVHKDQNGEDKTLCFIYSGPVQNAICDTQEAHPKAWVRIGPQSQPMSQELRDQRRIRVGALDIDSRPHCEYHRDDVDNEVLKEFRQVFRPDATQDFTDERLLREAGAIVDSGGTYFFTLPGLLFFASNPQRVVPHAYLRVMKFLVYNTDYTNRGTPSFEKDFKGPITKQIRDVRTLFQHGAFFERFQHRKSDGGWVEEPELPGSAVDEAIVNALAHRDYTARNPVFCERYADALVVKNPGRIWQQNIDLPDRFDLSSTTLESMPLNRKLVEWLRLMKDPEGKAFVNVISEGTKHMTRAMSELRLPPPSVVLHQNETLVILQSNVEERKKAFLESVQVPKTEFINLFPLKVLKGNERAARDEIHVRIGECVNAIKDAMQAHNWFIDRCSFSRIVAHRRGNDIPSERQLRDVVRFYPAYSVQVHELHGHVYLSCDYKCQVLNVLRAGSVTHNLSLEEVIGKGCVAYSESWRRGRIVSANSERMLIRYVGEAEEEHVPLSRVIPNLSVGQIEEILKQRNIRCDLYGHIKKASLGGPGSTARTRAEKIEATVRELEHEVFPVAFGEFRVAIEPKAVTLAEHGTPSQKAFPVGRISEPPVEVRNHQKVPTVREGITKFGSYDSEGHTVELVPVCVEGHRDEMRELIERLKTGKMRYRGAEVTFSTRLSYRTITTAQTPEDLDREVERLLSENPEWSGNRQLERLFLVHTPEAGYSLDDEQAPYFKVKRRLLEAGVPCQMVDTRTLQDADYKDLNLVLNIVAKCGVVPWVLPESIPEADFFVGLSCTSDAENEQRILGFANVFNSFGKWEFYAGNTAAFDHSQRSEHLSELVKEALKRLKHKYSLPAGPNLVFHHSLRISKYEYAAILSGVRSISPDATVSFVWVNAHNNFRLFDSRPETDGSLERGSFVPIARRRVLVSTTGHNAYRKPIGTPRPLELCGDVYQPGAEEPHPADARAIATQVLSLTKLNWGSTDSFSAEPITVKYAGEIAYLTAAFLRQYEPFRLHPVLEETPWFI